MGRLWRRIAFRFHYSWKRPMIKISGRNTLLRWSTASITSYWILDSLMTRSARSEISPTRFLRVLSKNPLNWCTSDRERPCYWHLRNLQKTYTCPWSMGQVTWETHICSLNTKIQTYRSLRIVRLLSKSRLTRKVPSYPHFTKRK